MVFSYRTKSCIFQDQNEKMSVEPTNGSKFAVRRSNVQVIADILAEAMNGASKTRLVYKANLNFKVMERYLHFLNGRNMIQLSRDEDGKERYFITQLGREFLLHYSQLEEMLKLDEQSVFAN